MTIEIESPIWNGGKRCVGLAEYRLKNEGQVTQVRILYKNKTGRYIYPTLLCKITEYIYKYPPKIVRNGVKVYIVPIEDFANQKFDLKERQHYEKTDTYSENFQETSQETQEIRKNEKTNEQASML